MHTDSKAAGEIFDSQPPAKRIRIFGPDKVLAPTSSGVSVDMHVGNLDPESTLKSARNVLQMVEASLPTIANALKSAILPLAQDLGARLLKSLNELLASLTATDQQLHLLLDTYFLTCQQLCTLHAYKSVILHHLVLRDLFEKEVEYGLRGHVPPLSRLVITSQPLASPIKKESKMDPVFLRLYTGARTNIDLSPRSGARCTASVVSDISLKGGEGIVLSGDEVFVTGDQIMFDSLQCNSCAFLQPIKLRFTLEIPNQDPVLHSDSSSPIIVYTNTKQWDSAQGTLLRDLVFDESTVLQKFVNMDISACIPATSDKVSAARYFNIVQYKYLSITSQIESTPPFAQHFWSAIKNSDKLDVENIFVQIEQVPSKITRPLTARDFDHFMQPVNKRLELSEHISKAEFDKIWEFVGGKFHVIKYTGKIPNLWREGLFWGLVTRQKAAEILRQFPVGTFLFRFAETGADIGVAYRQSETSVRHYLLKDNEAKDIITFIRDNSFTLLKFLRLTADDSERAQLSVLSVEDGFKRVNAKKPRKMKKVEDVVSEEDEYDTFMMRLSCPSPILSPSSPSSNDGCCPTCGAKQKSSKRKNS